MSWRNIRLIFNREVADQLRDRRTLFMVIVLPLLLYPALGIGMLQMSLLFSELPRTVVILGAADLPTPPLLNAEKTGFEDRWFMTPENAATLQVVTDAPPADGSELSSEVAEDRELQLAAGRAIQQKLEQIQQLKTRQYETQSDRRDGTEKSTSDPAPPDSAVSHTAATETPAAEASSEEKSSASSALPAHPSSPAASNATDDTEATIEVLSREIWDLFNAGNIEVLVIFPPGLSETIAAENRRLAQRELSLEVPTVRLNPKIMSNLANEKASIAYGRVRQAIDAWEQEILRERLEMANLPANLTSPVNAELLDLARPEELAANVWSRLFPAMLVIMAMTGAFHPAVDLGAGEKERGTMETLLISPALRSEIVIGKFLTVLLFSLVTAGLNLTSMGMTGLHILNSAGGGRLDGIGDFNIPSAGQLMWVAILAIPLASLFASLSLAFALFARSSKEGQYYLTPLLTVTMGLTVFCLSPAVEITPFYSLVPVMGPALLLKGLLLGGSTASGLVWYIVPVMSTSMMYSALGLLWAIDQFHREDVLFRESERFDLKLWFRHLLRDKETTPSFSEALFCFVLIMLLQFGLLNAFGTALNSAGDGERGVTMVRLLVIQQLVIIACPALFMGILLTKSPLITFQFRLPPARYWLFGLLLPLLLHPLALELQYRLDWFFPALKKDTLEALAAMSDGSLSLGLILFAFALTPAICEELAFRGFILSGFRHRGRDGLAIVISALLFGVMHMIPQQVFNAALLGLVLGLLAVKSGSIFPAMLFHFVNNTLGVLHGNLDGIRDTSSIVKAITVKSEFGIHYPVWLVALAAIPAGILLITLLRTETPRQNVPRT